MKILECKNCIHAIHAICAYYADADNISVLFIAWGIDAIGYRPDATDAKLDLLSPPKSPLHLRT